LSTEYRDMRISGKERIDRRIGRHVVRPRRYTGPPLKSSKTARCLGFNSRV